MRYKILQKRNLWGKRMKVRIEWMNGEYIMGLKKVTFSCSKRDEGLSQSIEGNLLLQLTCSDTKLSKTKNHHHHL